MSTSLLKPGDYHLKKNYIIWQKQRGDPEVTKLETLHRLAAPRNFICVMNRSSPVGVQLSPGMSLIYCQQHEPSSFCSCTGTKWPVTMGQIPHTPEASLTGHPGGQDEMPDKR